MQRCMHLLQERIEMEWPIKCQGDHPVQVLTQHNILVESSVLQTSAFSDGQIQSTFFARPKPNVIISAMVAPNGR